jgi:hypothetical protein
VVRALITLETDPLTLETDPRADVGARMAHTLGKIQPAPEVRIACA